MTVPDNTNPKMGGLLVGWMAGWLVVWLADWMIGLVSLLVGGSLAGWLGD
jgi:hypothetical protein